MYIILQRNGWKFATQGADYVIVNPQGEVVVRNMHKGLVEAEFMRRSLDTLTKVYLHSIEANLDN